MRLAGAATAAAALVLLTPVPASAGGPTSVLLASPTSRTATALYFSDQVYPTLVRLVGYQPVPDASAPNYSIGMAEVNITWLIHDVQIWRIDRVFTATTGNPWIETRISDDPGAVTQAKPVMHRATNSKDFLALLTDLKLLGPGQARAAAADAANAPPAPAAVNQPVSTTAAEPRAAGISWLWLLIGALVGAALAIAFRPLLLRRR